MSESRYFPSMGVLTAQRWPTNGHLVADVAKLGYLDGRVLDTTYGYGVFWKQWWPDELVTCDANSKKVGLNGMVADFRHLPFADQSFDSVVFDPPYKLNGTPDEDADERYGVQIPSRWQDRIQLMCDGLVDCIRVSRKYILVKCMDQVVSGKKVWQTHMIQNMAWNYYAVLEDRFDILSDPRPQPPGRRQVHSQANYSTLLVFRRTDV